MNEIQISNVSIHLVPSQPTENSSRKSMINHKQQKISMRKKSVQEK